MSRSRPVHLLVAVVLFVLAGACRRPAPVSAPPDGSTTTAATAAPAATPPALGASPATPRRLPSDRPDPPRLAIGVHGAVSTAEAHASDVGIEVLMRGGNAVDAAVAVAFALAVTHPSAGNIGGGGFMVVRMADGRTAAIDYRETAPGEAYRDMYLDARGEPTDASLTGARAAGIPGTVAGLGLAHARFGTRPWAELVEPAVRLARDGHVLDQQHAAALARGVDKMRRAGLSASAAYYQGPRGAPLGAGERWQQPELGGTLAAIATQGAAAFYRGPLAAAMVREVRRAGGIWRAEDLEGYRAIVREPLAFEHRGHQILTMPPPSAGGVVLRQILTGTELLHLERHPWQSATEVHLYLEAARRAYADRNGLLGDPDQVPLPLGTLLDRAYLARRMADVDPRHATPSVRVRAGLPPPRESEQTTHFSVVDDAGNAVASTTTLNTSFGAKLVLPGTGVLLNDEMDDFSVKPGSANVYGLVQSEPNAIAPGKRMLSSMTPTIVLRDGRLRAVLGTPGGPTITTTVAQILLALIDYGRPIDEAIAAPRIHHQWLPDEVMAEREAPAPLLEALGALGHQVVRRGPIGHANCIEIDPATGGYRAVADVGREGGKAVAY